ncbi:MAG: Hsp33 family molecular chaperone HslO [Bacilli bacterium]|nr:Hsp33 family molecular chaperone HslO [Bacilli bacterium]MDD4076382.1 Hsp33 family molecular chaperone HslO [Bacilli bacterium]MDD4389074.1 Hsp33 family molecular chaperone HslO [Bacilli bacterium]
MDYLIKSLVNDGRIRVYLAKTTDVCNDAIRIHDLWPSAASVLGKTMTIALIMGAMLKGDEALTIKIDGNGPIGQIIVDSNAKGEVRGYVSNPHVHFSRKGKLDDISTLGYNGYIDVIKDLKLKDLYTSTVPLQTGSLAKDFTYYFLHSEQTPTLTSLGIKIKENNTSEVSGGIIIQLMPKATEDDILLIERKEKQLSSLSELLLKHHNLEDIMTELFPNNHRILSTMPISFKCHCSKNSFARGIATLGITEINNIIEEDGKAEVVCHYCHAIYNFNIQDLEIIKKGLKQK